MSTDPSAPVDAEKNKAPVRKFMFERRFDDAKDVHRVERKPVLMKPEQIDALKKDSFDHGFIEGKAAAIDEAIANQSAVVNKINHEIGMLLKGLHGITQQQEELTRKLALSITKKILPALVEKNGTAEIEALINDTFQEMKNEPRIVIRLQESDYAYLNETIQNLAVQNAFPGKIVVLTDPNVASGDCQIEWAEGGIERNTAQTMAVIEETVLPSS